MMMLCSVTITRDSIDDTVSDDEAEDHSCVELETVDTFTVPAKVNP